VRVPSHGLAVFTGQVVDIQGDAGNRAFFLGRAAAKMQTSKTTAQVVNDNF